MNDYVVDQESVEIFAEMMGKAPGRGWGGRNYAGGQPYISRKMTLDDVDGLDAPNERAPATLTVDIFRLDNGRYECGIKLEASRPRIVIESPEHEPKATLEEAVQTAFKLMLNEVTLIEEFVAAEAVESEAIQGYGSSKLTLIG